MRRAAEADQLGQRGAEGGRATATASQSYPRNPTRLAVHYSSRVRGELT